MRKKCVFLSFGAKICLRAYRCLHVPLGVFTHLYPLRSVFAGADARLTAEVTAEGGLVGEAEEVGDTLNG